VLSDSEARDLGGWRIQIRDGGRLRILGALGLNLETRLASPGPDDALFFYRRKQTSMVSTMNRGKMIEVMKSLHPELTWTAR